MVAIQILGISESQMTNHLKANVEEALHRLGWDHHLEEVGEIDRLMQYDIMGIPALVMNGHVLIQKEIPEVEQLMEMLLQNNLQRLIKPQRE